MFLSRVTPVHYVWLHEQKSDFRLSVCFLFFSCCVDEVAAEHVRADCIVHYGPSCLSPCRRLPLLYVFGKRPIDVQQCAAAFKELYPDCQSHVIILYDVTYSHAIGNCYCLVYANVY